jgi:3-isopropylmalate/(R)-2-methylmalate dehydratase small subunit
MKLRGKAWKFAGVLDVDWEICPLGEAREVLSKYQQGELSEEEMTKELGKFCMTKVDPDFPSKAQPGDFLIGGEGMGYGHDHDHACVSIKGAGISAVLCEAAAGYFKRNSIHHGLPVIELQGIMAAVEQGDELEVDLVTGKGTNITSGKSLQFQPWPQFLLDMIQAGGLYPHIGMNLSRKKG